MNIKSLIIEFIDLIKKNQIEIYNEAALQYELAIFLRDKYPDYKIQLERNIFYFNLKKSNYEKKEIFNYPHTNLIFSPLSSSIDND